MLVLITRCFVLFLLATRTPAHAFLRPLAFPRSSGHGQQRKHDCELYSKSNRQSSRREIFKSTVTTIGGSVAAASSAQKASAASSPGGAGLLADLPMLRLALPDNALGADYIAMQICLQGQEQKPVEFMVDTGLTLEFVTPHLRDELGLQTESSRITSLSAGGSGTQDQMVTLKGAKICGDGTLRLPEMHAIVTDFPQEHVDPKHDPVEGMIGLELLSQYDVDFDFKAKQIRLYEPGTCPKDGLVEIPAVVVNDTGILGIGVASTSQGQPVLGLLDCGAPFSCVNWSAAKLLGLPPEGDKKYQSGSDVLAMGIDGKPTRLSTISDSLTFAGNAKKNDQGIVTGFESAPASWKPWKPVSIAVGDLPVFPELLGDGQRQYVGPAALIGLDILSQRRLIFESAGSANTRRRRIFSNPS